MREAQPVRVQKLAPKDFTSAAVIVTQAPGAAECQQQLVTAKVYVAALEKQVAALNDEVRALTAERDDLKKKLDECKHK